MANETVDAKGLACPKPLIMTKKKLTNLSPGGSMTVLIDNPTSKDNVVRFLKDNHAEVSVTAEGEVFMLHVTKREAELNRPEAENYCSPPQRPHVVCVGGNQMGSGDKELGEILIKACINTIKEVSPLPAKVVFYNSGILLAINGSPVVNALKELEERGVSILVCGTCTNFYGKTDEVAVGTISNMYDILEALSSAGHVVYP
ncbi:MAG: sulfurtransferase-like selenium metabolism protein YedF [Chitinivibrionales bacterium]|nr:sulfurtransferase-like selenium metabolism protein YedF [Chitinivibrionales bacterium]MBD3356400.1 sulfurtransferase-like selenium metabolism protein YedF [Chitinivibrionales bacterium]